MGCDCSKPPQKINSTLPPGIITRGTAKGRLQAQQAQQAISNSSIMSYSESGGSFSQISVAAFGTPKVPPRALSKSPASEIMEISIEGKKKDSRDSRYIKNPREQKEKAPSSTSIPRSEEKTPPKLEMKDLISKYPLMGVPKSSKAVSCPVVTRYAQLGR